MKREVEERCKTKDGGHGGTDDWLVGDEIRNTKDEIQSMKYQRHDESGSEVARRLKSPSG